MHPRRMALAGASLAVALAISPAANAAPFGLENLFSRADRQNDSVILAQAGDAERFARIENTMRNLTGQIEELTHQLRVMQEQLQRLQADMEFRMGEIEGGTGAVAPSANRQATLAAPSDQLDTIGTLTDGQQISNADLQLGTPPQPLGQLTLDAPPADGSQPLDLSTLSGAPADAGFEQPQPGMVMDQQQVAAVQLTGDPRTDYDQAYGMIRTGRYDLAESAFREFLSRYPGDELASEAQYWLGESLFARGEYGRAAEEFRAGYKAYPGSRRGPDTLLKLGLSMAGLGYRDEACQMYAATVNQYPDMSNALRQRVRNEQASANC